MILDPNSAYGAWSGAQIERFLAETRIPLRVSLETRAGLIIVPLWFEFRTSRFVACSPEDSVLVRSMRQNPRVAFDISTNDLPYKGVRGRGNAVCTTAGDNRALAELLERYVGGTQGELAQWLLNRTGDEALIEIEPVWLTSWDFSERMQDLTINSERFPDGAL